METHFIRDEAAMRTLAASFANRLGAGDVVLLEGELGAGKTTWVRGLVEALGFDSTVRSPTFNLVQSFPTDPPVMHADLYRVSSYQGIGLEDYLESHICLIEWPDRAAGLLPESDSWRIRIDFEPMGRLVHVLPPAGSPTQDNESEVN